MDCNVKSPRLAAVCISERGSWGGSLVFNLLFVCQRREEINLAPFLSPDHQHLRKNVKTGLNGTSSIDE